MTKTDQAYRKWLDSLKPGDEVAVVVEGSPCFIRRIVSRTKRDIRTDGGMYSARTGADDLSRIAPVEQSHRAAIYQREASRRISLAINPRTPIPTLRAIELLLEWQYRESVATHVIELIHNLTREDLPQ